MSATSAPTTSTGPPWAAWLVQRAPSAAVSAVLAWWATYLTWGTGGREPHVLSFGCLLLAAAFVLVRPDVRLPGPVLLVGHSVALGAWLVVVLAPTGWHGRDDAASWTFAAELTLVLLAWATTAHRRLVVAAAVLGAAGAQFAVGWLPWWGAQDQSKLFQGTFYWHNQAGIFLAAGALLALAVVAVPGPLTRLAWVVVPLAVAGTVYSTSRGSLLGLALGAVLLLLSAGPAQSWRPRVRIVVAAAVAWVVTVTLTGPPFFADRVAPTAGTEARAGSFVGNGVQRLEDWRRAWEIFTEWPLTGAGFDSFRFATTVVTTRRDGVDTAFAHNGFLQAMADGGLLLAGPLLVAVGCVLVVTARCLPRAVARGDLLQVGGSVTLLVLLLHSGMDFDWAYPSLLALFACVVVLALPPLVPRAENLRSAGTGARRTTRRVVLISGVGLLVLSSVAAWSGGLSLNTTF